MILEPLLLYAESFTTTVALSSCDLAKLQEIRKHQYMARDGRG